MDWVFVKNEKYFAIAFAVLCLIALCYNAFSLTTLLWIYEPFIGRTVSYYFQQNPTQTHLTENSTKIVIWLPKKVPTLPKRLDRLTKLVNATTLNPCFKGCTAKLSSNQEDADDADALVFYMFTVGFQRVDLPVRKDPSQIWVYQQQEPVFLHKPRVWMNGIFNWTMTYRKDSDLYNPEAWTVPKSKEEVIGSITMPGNATLEEWIKGKTGLVAAVISNCYGPSKRLQIIKKLNNISLHVDVFGSCGNHQSICGYGKHDCPDFWNIIASKYKFYLSFENSYCVDYVTEKFWRTLETGMVPIVLGRVNYLEIAPPQSFINLRNYSVPQQLSRLLRKLDQNDTEYAKYFQWRKTHRIVDYRERDINGLCHLCQKLRRRKELLKSWNGVNSSMYSKSKQDLAEWWRNAPRDSGGGPACLSPEQMGLVNFLY